MAVTRHEVPVPPQDVWAQLADPHGYAFWVVGAAAIRRVEGDWPQPGATFHHTQGRLPLKLRDTSTVLECDEGRRLKLEVRARPLVVAHVEITLEPTTTETGDEGTTIVMREELVGGTAKLLGPLNEPALLLRNEETLKRLAAMSWARHDQRTGGARDDEAVVAGAP
jgi:uncharacterized protein YndB with AHSA1/START domain